MIVRYINVHLIIIIIIIKRAEILFGCLIYHDNELIFSDLLTDLTAN